MSRARTRRGVTLLASALLLAALLALILHPKKQVWSLDLQSEEADLTPWQTAHLSAVLKPMPSKSVTWSWTSNGEEFSRDGPKAEWHGSLPGDYAIEVTATSDGTTHTTQTTLRIRLREYVTESGKHMLPPPEASKPIDGGAPLPFSIADVWVEKSEVCQGEPTRIRLTAADTRGREKWLTPIVDGVQGWEVPFVAAPSAPGLRRVTVLLMDGRPGEVNKPFVTTDVYVEVKDCMADFPIYVEQAVVPPDPDVIELKAHVFDGPAWARRLHNDPEAGVRGSVAAPVALYSWDFGDGTTGSSPNGRVQHRYPAEPERAGGRESTYVGKVDAFSADGAKLATGYATIVLPNAYGAQLDDSHVLQLITHVPPGPASTLDDGSRSVAVTAYNIDRTETAYLTGLKLRHVPCSGSPESPRTIDVRSVFASDRVEPRATISGNLTVLAGDIKGACSVEVEIEGHSGPGQFSVTGWFALDPGALPGQALPPERSEMVARAAALLDASIVTEDDLRRLEAEGKLPSTATARSR